MLAAGEGRAQIVDLVSEHRLLPLLTRLADQGRTVIVDGGSLLDHLEGRAFAGVSDVVVLVAGARASSRTDVRRACRELSVVANCAVALLNDVPAVLADALPSRRRIAAANIPALVPQAEAQAEAAPPVPRPANSVEQASKPAGAASVSAD